MNFMIKRFNEEVRAFFPNGADLFPCKCAFHKDDIAPEEMGILQEQNSLT